MLLFLKSTSTTVHHYHHDNQDEEKYNNNNSIDHGVEALSCTSLTVWRKSLLLSCSGFTVIGSDGGLAYRVDNYTGQRTDPLVLMDGSGNPIFTICRRKKMMLVDNYWLVYEGEVDKNFANINKSSKKLPIFCVRKNINIMRKKLNVLAHVYFGILDERHTYTIEGSYRHRSCKIVDGCRRVLGEIKKKEAMHMPGGVSFGLDVFHLIVNPGFDSRFAMAIVLLLDQMFS